MQAFGPRCALRGEAALRGLRRSIVKGIDTSFGTEMGTGFSGAAQLIDDRSNSIEAVGVNELDIGSPSFSGRRNGPAAVLSARGVRGREPRAASSRPRARRAVLDSRVHRGEHQLRLPARR